MYFIRVKSAIYPAQLENRSFALNKTSPLDLDKVYLVNTVERMTVILALAMRVKASCTIHWVAF